MVTSKEYFLIAVQVNIHCCTERLRLSSKLGRIMIDTLRPTI
jgi:hypothetical protein